MAQPKNYAASKTISRHAEVATPKRARGKVFPPDVNSPKPVNDNGNAAATIVPAADQSSGSETHPKAMHETTSGQSGSATYAIGYKKPPKHTRFRKGQSGNPKGRAKGARNIWTILQEEARIVVAFSENGKPSKASKTELAIRSAMNKAVKGDLRALQIILKLFETHAPSPETVGRSAAVQAPAISRHEMDREILDMLGLSEHLSPSEASSDDPPADDTDKPQN